MTRKMITLLCILLLLAVFPGRASRAAASTLVQMELPPPDDVVATWVRIAYRPPGYAYLPLMMK